MKTYGIPFIVGLFCLACKDEVVESQVGNIIDLQLKAGAKLTQRTPRKAKAFLANNIKQTPSSLRMK